MSGLVQAAAAMALGSGPPTDAAVMEMMGAAKGLLSALRMLSCAQNVAGDDGTPR